MLSSFWVISSTTLIVALGSFLIRPKDTRWFRNLERPNWLNFEFLIPVIWMIVFAGGIWSAYLTWQHAPGESFTWFLMGLYLLVELVTVTYIPLMLRFHDLRIGLVLGASGVILAAFLTVILSTTVPQAVWFLLPYLLWSPVGTLTTGQMIQLNPDTGTEAG